MIKQVLTMALVSGCAVYTPRKVDMCAGLAPGQTRIADVRLANLPFSENYTWPWATDVTLQANMSLDTALVCQKMNGEKCVKATPVHLCLVQSESPSTSAIMQDLSSPISTAFSKLTVTPTLP
jgi:hypothetical protein